MVWGLLLAWHLPVTGGLLYGTAKVGPEAVFVGAAWGWEVPFALLSVPFVVFSGLVALQIARELRGASTVETIGWADVDRRALVGAALLLPVAAVMFRFGGDGYDGMVRMAIATTVLQWILLGVGLNGRGKEESKGNEGPPHRRAQSEFHRSGGRGEESVGPDVHAPVSPS